MSTPITLPSGPTALAARKQSMPPPLPKSTTVSPAFSAPIAVGLPQPADAITASVGSPSTSWSVYRFVSVSQHESTQQPSAALATSEYRSLTNSLISMCC